MGVFDKNPALFDLEHAVGKIAELEDIAGHTFKGKVFIQAADKQAFGLQDDVVIKLVGNRTTIGNGSQACTAPWPQHAIDNITVQVGATPTTARMETVGQHLYHVDKLLFCQVVIRARTFEHLVQCLLMPFAPGYLGNDLLGQYIQRMLRNQDTVKFIPPDRVEHGYRFHQVITAEREQPGFGCAGEVVSGTAGALQEGRNAARRAHLAYQVDITDIDTQLQ